MGSGENNVEYRFVSKIYELFDLIFLLGGKGNPRSGLLEMLRDTPQSILDVCVGTAASSVLVATHCLQSRVLGIDISDDMLAVARRKIRQAKLTNLEVKHMSATAMALADSSFDVVMVSFALHEFEPAMREKTFKEMARVLKRGGKLCVLDFARQANRRNQVFLKVWTLIEPSCFAGFLDIDWRRQLEAYGLRYESEEEYSFSKLYVLSKA